MIFLSFIAAHWLDTRIEGRISKELNPSPKLVVVILKSIVEIIRLELVF
jgi:hypothetical protein